MKTDWLDYSLDYLRFTIEADGEQFNDELADQFKDILKGELKAEKAVASFIRSEHLDASRYNGEEDELSYYPGTRCLVNYFGITDKPQLRRIDKRISSYRTAELLCAPLDMPFSFRRIWENGPWMPKGMEVLFGGDKIELGWEVSEEARYADLCHGAAGRSVPV